MQKFCGAPDTKAPLMLVPVDWQEAVTGVFRWGDGGGRAIKLPLFDPQTRNTRVATTRMVFCG